jgi:hypothetical protein
MTIFLATLGTGSGANTVMLKSSHAVAARSVEAQERKAPRQHSTAVRALAVNTPQKMSDQKS